MRGKKKRLEKEAYRQHFELEESYWWFQARKHAAEFFLNTLGTRRKQSQSLILDVGCGTGGMFGLLEKYGKVFGLDLSSEALAYARKRGASIPLIQGKALLLPFPDEQFDGVTAFNLLYHQSVEDDLKALKEFHRVCKIGGFLLLTDSAFESLRSAHDRFFHGVRRYRIKTLKPKIESSGFRIKRISYMNMTSFPFVYLWRKLLQKEDSDLTPLPSPVNKGLSGVAALEMNWLKHWNLPFGISLICLAQK